MGDPNLVRSLTRNFSQPLFVARFVILCLAFALGVVALMNPRRPGEADKVTRKGIDLVIALDVSNSMLATDLAPDRLERAKQFIIKLINTMPDDRIGLVLFAGSAYLQMPLTIDHGAARLYISSASPEAVSQQGTNLKEAMRKSLFAFNPKERRFKAMVLISDGEDHDPESEAEADEMASKGVMINTVGVGSPEGSTIPDLTTGDFKKDEAGNTVVSKLNEQSLKAISEKTNGVYIRLDGSDAAVAALKEQLSQIESKAYTDVSLINYETFYMWFAGAMLFLLLLENFIPERKKIVPA